MATIVLFLLFAMGFGAFALGRRFRIYSFATMLLVVALGAVTGALSPHVAAGEPTPGLGIIERVMVYASVLWPGVLGLALAQGPRERLRHGPAPDSPRGSPSQGPASSNGSTSTLR
jgi:hypothetical protein